jgi:hypothetical protein
VYNLRVAAPNFILAAIQAGKEADFEGTILIFTRGLSKSHKKELVASWSDLDDATHNDILVLTFGVSPRKTGIPHSGLERNVVADKVSVAYPFSKSFTSTFEQLLKVAEHIPSIGDDPKQVPIDTHGTTDIRRMLGLAEQQLPAIFIVSYKHEIEYVVELGLDEIQISPVKFISALVRNLDDKPYMYRNEQPLPLWQYSEERLWQLKEKRMRLDKLARGHVEERINLTQIPIDGSSNLMRLEEKLIEVLYELIEIEGPNRERLTMNYESSLAVYASALEQEIAEIEEAQRRLEEAVRQLKSTKTEEQRIIYQAEVENHYRKLATLVISTKFKSAVEFTLKLFRLELRSQSHQINIQAPSIFSNCTRKTYSLQEIKPDTRSKVFISYSHKDVKWLKRLQVHLKPLELDGTITCWDDTSIKPGNKWREEIEKAIASAKIAVLLISADFLASDFISTNELPSLLAAAEKEGVIIMPVVVSPCLFHLTSSLSQFQAVGLPERPLSGITRNEQEKALVKIAEAIKNVFLS